MKVNYGRDFTPEELTIISGKKRPATRKEVKAWLEGLIERTLNGETKLGDVGCGVTDSVNHHRTTHTPVLLTTMGQTCSPLDHLFPGRMLPPSPGTECYCGQRKWK